MREKVYDDLYFRNKSSRVAENQNIFLLPDI